MTCTTENHITHIYFVLDRSGSMGSIADDVIGGFNAFLANQKAEGDDALMTFVQFDSQNAQEYLCVNSAIGTVAELNRQTYVPRGGTPLFDAMGFTMSLALQREIELKAASKPAENVVFITFTDGQENASAEYTRERIFNLVNLKQEEGWTFVFMGANQDAYAAGGDIGVGMANASNWVADSAGTTLAFRDLSVATRNRRVKTKAGLVFDSRDLFEGDKSADADAARRR
ncbi:MAG: VWA domain-containing protein [Acidobacteria bacterium]|nr:VWA domain-containing protein [Acidobacteriota bacterium]